MADYPRGEKGMADWNKLVAEMKKAGKDKRYDCLIGVSGGVDSSYLLHLATEYGLRPLAVNLDNGFNSEIAVQNIYKVTQKLGIDLETYVINYEEIKDLLKAYMNAGMPWADAPTDRAIKATMYKIAGKEDIKYVIRGNDFRSEGKQPKEWTYTDDRQLGYIHRRFGSGIRLKTYPRLSLIRQIYCGLIQGIKDIRPFYFLPYQKQTAKDLLMREYDWRDYGGHHHENLFTKFVMAYWLPVKFGIDKRVINLSAQVLSGAISRETAITLLDSPSATEEELKKLREYVLKKLDITEETFVDYLKKENKSFKSYPSNYDFLFSNIHYFGWLLRYMYTFKPMSVTAEEYIKQ